MEPTDGASRGTVVFVSPHLDDAVLSTGALMQELAARHPILVVTVFSEASAPPHGRAARSFLSQCLLEGEVPTADALFAARRLEDLRAISAAGAEARHLGHPDALFRARSWSSSSVGSRVSTVLPDLAHRYPTYRFDIARGRVGRGDRELSRRIENEIAGIIETEDAAAVFAPVGIGRHVDHLITRDAVLAVRPDAILWADQPYLDRGDRGLDPLIVAGRERWSWDQGLDSKVTLIEQYATQVSGLFRHGGVPRLEEHYYGSKGLLFR